VARHAPTIAPLRAASYVAPRAERIIDEGTVIENVTLISPERAAPLAHADVVIRDGRIAELGSIQVGKRADLLLLRRNPLADIAAYDSIETIFLDGTPVARDSLRSRN
jgi:predicted amidohydrolase YtcJ